MALSLYEVTFNPLRSITTHRELVWSRMMLSFKDSESDCFPLVELTLLQTARPETTIAELEREGTDRAKTILRAALAALEERDVTSILQKQAETAD